jgi:MraZ protein
MRFIGTHLQTIDPKGRLVLPAKFVRLLPEGQSGMVLTVGPDPCLLLYPLHEWNQLAESLNALVRNEATRNAVRFVSDHSTELELDAHGRLTVPREFLKRVGIEREVTIVGLLRYIELWPRVIYEREVEARRIASKGVLDGLI